MKSLSDTLIKYNTKITFQQKTHLQPMFEYKEGMEKEHWWEQVSISEADEKAGHPREGDMIAFKPSHTRDKWLVNQNFFEENYEEIFVK